MTAALSRLAIISVLLSPALLRADGGTVCLMQERAGLRITVFASPTPLRVGPAEISVLVQDTATGRTRTDLPILVHAFPVDESWNSQTAAATTEAATNKLLCCAPLELSRAGRWQVQVAISAPGELVELSCELEAAPAQAAWVTFLPWLGWPFVFVLLFLVHQLLVRRSQFRRTKQGSEAGCI